MKFMITESFLKELVKHRALDKKMIASLAAEFIAQTDSTELAKYLLTKEVAVALLAERLQKDPVAEFRRLKEITPEEDARPRRRGRPAKSDKQAQPRRRGRPPKSNGVSAKTATGRRKKRLSADKSDKLKDEIREFLKANPGSSRLQILNSVKIPTTAIYNRLMVALKETNEIVSKGEKRNAVYYLK